MMNDDDYNNTKSNNNDEKSIDSSNNDNNNSTNINNDGMGLVTLRCWPTTSLTPVLELILVLMTLMEKMGNPCNDMPLCTSPQ